MVTDNTSARTARPGRAVSRATPPPASLPLFVFLALFVGNPSGAFAAEWLPATVELSDGTRIEGRVQITDDAVIINNEAQARRYTVRAAEMAKLETTIERQSMEEKWMFRESGLDDKVYTGERYPVREYLTSITFRDGRQLEGHIVPKTLYVESEGKRRRFILRHKDEGQVGQKLEDLLYVRAIAFKQESAGALGAIEGTLLPPDGERLEKVLAVNRDKLFAIEAAVNPASGKFRVPDCTEGTYDLLAVTNKAVYLYFSGERDKGSGRLTAEQVAGVQSWIDKLRDFFHTQKVVYAAGNEERLFALICEERLGGTTSGEAQYVRRYEVWAMHKPGGEWQIDKRMFVQRTPSDKPLGEALAVVIVPELGAHVVSAQSAALQLDLKLAPNRESPIPAVVTKAASAPPEAERQADGH
jgi:hypothetical protein